MNAPPQKAGGTQKSLLPKGSYRLPQGGYVVESVGASDKRGRQVKITAVHRDEFDADKIARALIDVLLESLLKDKPGK